MATLTLSNRGSQSPGQGCVPPVRSVAALDYKEHNKCNALESSQNHPLSRSMEKLLSMKPVSGAEKIGECCCKTQF